jgi:hypothetical protein
MRKQNDQLDYPLERKDRNESLKATFTSSTQPGTLIHAVRKEPQVKEFAQILYRQIWIFERE